MFQRMKGGASCKGILVSTDIRQALVFVVVVWEQGRWEAVKKMVSDLHDQALAFICRAVPVMPKDLLPLNSGRKVKRACPVLIPTLQGALS